VNLACPSSKISYVEHYIFILRTYLFSLSKRTSVFETNYDSVTFDRMLSAVLEMKDSPGLPHKVIVILLSSSLRNKNLTIPLRTITLYLMYKVQVLKATQTNKIQFSVSQLYEPQRYKKKNWQEIRKSSHSSVHVPVKKFGLGKSVGKMVCAVKAKMWQVQFHAGNRISLAFLHYAELTKNYLMTCVY